MKTFKLQWFITKEQNAYALFAANVFEHLTADWVIYSWQGRERESVDNHTEIFTAKIIILPLVSGRECEFYKLGVGLYNNNMRLWTEYTY